MLRIMQGSDHGRVHGGRGATLRKAATLHSPEVSGTARYSPGLNTSTPMVQYEMAVYLYGHNEVNDGIAIEVHRTPAASGHLELGAAQEFSAATTVCYNYHSEHTLTMLAPPGEASRGAFAATVVHNFACALNSTVKSIEYECAEYVTATLYDDMHIPEAHKPNQPTKRKDDPRGSYVGSPGLFFGFGRVDDERKKWPRALQLYKEVHHSGSALEDHQPTKKVRG